MTATSFSFDPAALAAYELSVRVGELASFHGQTDVQLRGDGSFVAVQRGPEVKKSFEAKAQLDRAQTEFVLRSAAQLDWSDRFPSRPGIPDEPIVYWSIRVPGGGSASLRMWLRDAERGALTSEVLSLFRQVLERASDGRMYL